MKSFQRLLNLHDVQKRKNMQQKAFSVIGAKIQKQDWVYGSDSVVKTAAMLAWEGYLTSLKDLSLINKDITDIPRVEVEKLASIVTESVWIDNMTPIRKLDSILAGVQVQCTELWLDNIELSEEHTRALVTTMRNRVEQVRLYSGITLDIMELTKYDGRGCCRKIKVEKDARTRYGSRLRNWATHVRWTVNSDSGWLSIVKRC